MCLERAKYLLKLKTQTSSSSSSNTQLQHIYNLVSYNMACAYDESGESIK